MSDKLIKKTREVFDVSDVLINDNEAGDRRAMLPLTRYDSLLGRPKIVTSNNIPTTGAPYHILKQDTVKMSLREIRELCGDII